MEVHLPFSLEINYSSMVQDKGIKRDENVCSHYLCYIWFVPQALLALVFFCTGPHQFLHKDNKKLLCDLSLVYLLLSIVFSFWPYLSWSGLSHVQLPIPKVAKLHISTLLIFFYSSALALLFPSLIYLWNGNFWYLLCCGETSDSCFTKAFTFFTFGPSSLRYLQQLSGVHECWFCRTELVTLVLYWHLLLKPLFIQTSEPVLVSLFLTWTTVVGKLAFL